MATMAVGFGNVTTAISKEEDTNMAMIEQHHEWLLARGITDATIERFGLHSKSDGHGQWLRVPFMENGQVVNHKWRKTMAKDHRMDKDAPLLLWNHRALVEAARTGAALVITEGEWDGMIADQSGWPLVTSVPNGADDQPSEDVFTAKRYEWFHRHRPLLDKVQKFILATDGDEAGRILAADLARLLGPERCWYIDYPEGSKDLNEVALGYSEQQVMDTLFAAKPYPVVGLYKMYDFPEHPDFSPTGLGIDGLDELWPLVPGTFTIVTGWPSHGKSTAVLAAVASLIKRGVPLALGSFETMVKPVLQRRLRATVLGCHEAEDLAKRSGPADDMINEKLSIISNLHANDDTELTIERIIELAIVAVLRDGIKLLVLDPWNEMEHKRGRDESETDYVGRAIRLLKRFGKDYHCAVWVVAHPRKPNTDGTPKKPSLLDLSGSAHFANKADYGVIFHRDNFGDDIVVATVCKKRMGLPGAMGQVTLAWAASTSSYHKVRME
jgi:twinkle protein